jgi:ABC-2 type transport system ATP-binding protein
VKLSLNQVGKLYQGKVWALADFKLKLGAGVLGLLGPNGAGKSTLMRILATVTKPTRGQITWEGHDILRDPDSLRSVLGYLPQDFGVYPHLNAVEFLEYLAAVKGLAAAQRAGGSTNCSRWSTWRKCGSGRWADIREG